MALTLWPGRAPRDFNWTVGRRSCGLGDKHSPPMTGQFDSITGRITGFIGWLVMAAIERFAKAFGMVARLLASG
jgi:hypothetical protein